eukprot:GGOE01015174.1.p1 GENE.GGOE01015174.1~~GGOE01015174.1.p1  ORF type:complete len:658 (+),score=167.36 GGOE01015174.1:48-2021(+)
MSRGWLLLAPLAFLVFWFLTLGQPRASDGQSGSGVLPVSVPVSPSRSAGVLVESGAPAKVPVNSSPPTSSGGDGRLAEPSMVVMQYGASPLAMSPAGDMSHVNEGCPSHNVPPVPYPYPETLVSEDTACAGSPFARRDGATVHVTCPAAALQWTHDDYSGAQRWVTAPGTAQGVRVTMETQFLEVRCGNRSQVFLRFRPPPSSLLPPLPPGPPPPNILLVTVDCIFRHEYFFWMRRTQAVIHEAIAAGAYRPFVFSKSTAVGPFTALNMYPVLAGHEVSAASEKRRHTGTCPKAVNPWVWEVLPGGGFVSAYTQMYAGLFGCHAWQGPSPLHSIHHPIPTKMDPNRRHTLRRQPFQCIDHRLSASHDVDFAIDFFRNANYADRPKFMYMHFDEPHHKARFAVQVDLALPRLLRAVMLAPNANTIVVLMSDHASGHQYYANLMHFLLPKDFLSRFPREAAELHRNQRKLTSPFDVYLTLLDMGTLFGTRQPIPTVLVPRQAQSLFRRIAQPDRPCSEIGIPSLICPCDGWKPVRSPNRPFLLSAVSRFLATVNADISHAPNSSCASLTVANISRAFLKIPSTPAYLKKKPRPAVKYARLEFTVQQTTYSRFLIEVAVKGGGQQETLTRQQVTTYAPFQACHDRRLDITFCVCGDLVGR